MRNVCDSSMSAAEETLLTPIGMTSSGHFNNRSSMSTQRNKFLGQPKSVE